MRPPEILGLLLRAFGIWLLVMGLIHLPAVIASALFLNSPSPLVMPHATTSRANETVAEARGQLNDRMATLRGDLRGILLWPAITELMKVAFGVVLLVGSDRWAEWAYRQKKQPRVPAMFSES